MQPITHVILGTPNLVANGIATQKFDMLPFQGAVSDTIMSLSMGLANNAGMGAAFNLSVQRPGAAAGGGGIEGSDDLDKIANPLVSKLVYSLDGVQRFALDIQRLRGVLNGLNMHDVGGSIDDGVAIGANGAPVTLSIDYVIPEALTKLLGDFGRKLTRQGVDRMRRTAIMQATMGANLTPAIVLKNGTAIVSGAVLTFMALIDPEGEAGDTGFMWTVTEFTSQGLPLALPDVIHLLVLDRGSAAAANLATFTFEGVVNKQLVTGSQLATDYQMNRLTTGGYPLEKRYAPLVFQRALYDVDDLGKSQGPITIKATGISTINVLDVRLEPPSAVAIQAVSQSVGGGGAVSTAHPAPAKYQGKKIPKYIEHLLPVRVRPGIHTTPGFTAHTGPASAARYVSAKQVRGAQALELMRGRYGLRK